jgi:adiponectin receptor
MTLTLSEVPRSHNYLCDPYTFSGYQLYSSKKDALVRAPFSLTNQTFNIWSHFLSGVYILSKYDPTRQPYPLQSYILSAALCFLLSSYSHINMGISKKVDTEISTCDYLGIFLLIFTSFLPSIHFVFPTETRNTLYTLLSIIWGSSIKQSLNYGASLDTNKKLRIFLYATPVIVSLMLVCGVTIKTYGILSSEFQIITSSKSLAPESILYTLSLFVYTTRYPEKLFPGKFDYVGSHGLWHVGVFMGVIVRLSGYEEIMREDLEGV